MTSRNYTKLYSNAKETQTPEEVVVEGKVPSYVHGTYLKVGPGKFFFEKTGFSVNHYFDGYSCIAQFEIKDGNKVSIQNKLLPSDVYKRAIAAGKSVVCEFGTPAQPDPNKGWLAKCIPQLIPEMSDNSNMNLYQIGENLIAAGESCFFRDINKTSLEVGERYDTNKCYGLNFVSVHFLKDPDTGDTYTVGSSLITGLKYNFVKIPPQPVNSKPLSTKEMLKKSSIIASISSQASTLLSMHHSFGMSSNYLVFIEQPYVLNVTKIFSAVLSSKPQCFFDWMEWRGGPDLTNRFYLVHKKSGKVLKTEIVTEEPFMFTHFINCVEEDGHLICDLLRFDNGDLFQANFITKLLTEERGDSTFSRVDRYVIPLSHLEQNLAEENGKELLTLKNTTASAKRVGNKGKILLKSESLTRKGLEFPCINKAFVGKPYKYFYCTGNTSPKGYYESTLLKMDLISKTTLEWHGSESCIPGQPVFIQNPDANEGDEDNGVILSLVISLKEEERSDYLLFLDAKTFKEVGRARFRNKVPYLIHGLFIPNNGNH